MLFSVSGIECNPFLPFAMAFAISFFTSMGGISGAFLLLPFQINVLGYTAPGVSATNQFFNVVACPAGVWRYWREGRLIWPLALAIAAGTLPGVFIGAVIRIYVLRDLAHFKLFVACVLFYMFGRMVKNLFKNFKKSQQTTNLQNTTQNNCVTILKSNLQQLVFSFQGQQYNIKNQQIILLSMIIGLIGGIYGIGGGAIMAPFLIEIFHLPVYVTASATLLATALTSFAGVACYALLALMQTDPNAAPDWLLGWILGLGGMCGMYCGARCQQYVPLLILKLFLSIFLLFTVVSLVL